MRNRLARWTSEQQEAIEFVDAVGTAPPLAALIEQSTESYWRGVGGERGGSELVCCWHPSVSNGYVVMGADVRAFNPK